MAGNTMDNLLERILADAANNPSPDSLANALRLVEEVRRAKEADNRALLLAVQNKELELALNKELELALKAGGEDTNGSSSSSSSRQQHLANSQNHHHHNLQTSRQGDASQSQMMAPAMPTWMPAGNAISNNNTGSSTMQQQQPVMAQNVHHHHHSHYISPQPETSQPASWMLEPPPLGAGEAGVGGVMGVESVGRHAGQQAMHQMPDLRKNNLSISTVQYPPQNTHAPPSSGIPADVPVASEGQPPYMDMRSTPAYTMAPQQHSLYPQQAPLSSGPPPQITTYHPNNPQYMNDYGFQNASAASSSSSSATRFPQERHWNDGLHALFTFGLEDFGHASMPRSSIASYELDDMGPSPTMDQQARYSGTTNYTTSSQYESTSSYPSTAPPFPAPDVGKAHGKSGTPTSQSSSTASAATRQQQEASSGSSNSKQSTTRKKRQIVEEEARCLKCQNLVAIYLLHGDAKSLAVPYEIRIVCCDCKANDPDKAQRPPGGRGSGLVPGSRKRATISIDDQEAVCEVCKRQVAVGGVHMVDTSESNELEVEPDFGVEVICSPCRGKYALCTECGGGRRFRTGKWRPIGLFERGRRTCKLPHVRIGSTPIHFQEWLVPSTLSNNMDERSMVLRNIEKYVPAMYFHRLAIPEVMELDPPNELATFEQLQHRVNLRCHALRDFVLNEDLEERLGVRRYFAGAWIRRVSRHLRKERNGGKANAQQQQQQQKAAGKQAEDKSSEHPTMMIAMMIIWWDMRSGCLRLAALQALNTEFTTGGIIFRMCRRVLERCIADREQIARDSPNPPPPISFLGLPVFEEFARLPTIQHTLERLGFLNMEDFERQHPEVDPATVARALADQGSLFGTSQYRRTCFVGHIKQLLAGPWGKENKTVAGRESEKEATKELMKLIE
ncbi:hypothetical protein DFS34DRAFT_612515 [Phlyctochytrium arcticum]|nr:hypothetical protein DFS34DRAFT_612515 [Phlyctochytrium arcticum]